MEIRKVKVKDIKFSPFQYKEYDLKKMEKLRESLNYLGLISPLVVYKKGTKYVLIDGNHRLEELKNSGVEFVDVIVLNETERSAMLKAVLINENIFDLDIGAVHRFVFDDDKLKEMCGLKFYEKEKEVKERLKKAEEIDKVKIVFNVDFEIYLILSNLFTKVNSESVIKKIIEDYERKVQEKV